MIAMQFTSLLIFSLTIHWNVPAGLINHLEIYYLQFIYLFSLVPIYSNKMFKLKICVAKFLCMPSNRVFMFYIYKPQLNCRWDILELYFQERNFRLIASQSVELMIL